jgi:hypothetical protein
MPTQINVRVSELVCTIHTSKQSFLLHSHSLIINKHIYIYIYIYSTLQL